MPDTTEVVASSTLERWRQRRTETYGQPCSCGAAASASHRIEDASAVLEGYLCGACLVALQEEIETAGGYWERCDGCQTVTLADNRDDAANRGSVLDVRGSGAVFVCDRCAENLTECSECDRYSSAEDSCTIADAEYCEHCRDRVAYYCDYCNEWRLRRDPCDCETEEEDEDGTGGIDSYGTRPCLTFLAAEGEAVTADTHYYGLELEVEFCDAGDKAGIIQAVRGRPWVATVTHDGSLTDGFEIVTHPGTAAYWQSQTAGIAKLLRYLSSEGCRSHEPATCGLHVHVGRKGCRAPLSPLALYRFMRLIYGYPVFSLALSRRSRDKLAQWASLEDPAVIARKAAGKLESERYVAVNLSQSHGTVEVRMYRGTLNPDSFHAALEHVVALATYAVQDVPPPLVTLRAFLIWCKGQGDTYARFLAAVARRGQTATDGEDS